MYFVYILESVSNGEFYKGSSSDYFKRLEQHNNGESHFTSDKGPWKLIFVQEMEDKRSALILEKKLKKCNKNYLRWLVTQPVNFLNAKKQFL